VGVIASKVVGGDLIDSCSVVGNPAYTLNNEEIGIRFDIKGSSIFGFLGRFELEIPAGATITGVRIQLFSNGVGAGASAGNLWAMGFVDDDSIWPAGGFNSTTYPTRVSLPWPRRMSGDPETLIDNPGAWVGDAYPATSYFAEPVIPFGQDLSFSEGPNMSPQFKEVTGLVSNLQQWLDSNPDRSNSASGTAIPSAFAIVFGGTSGFGYQGALTSFYPNYNARPSLTVRFDTFGQVSATNSVTGLVDARAESTTVASASGSVSSTVAARGQVT
jgi:hypothetical protein